MWENLLWLYMITATVLVVHEIDSAYWKEWELFHLPGGPGFFLLLHLPLVFFIIFGAVLIDRKSEWGLVIGGVVSASGFIAFILHSIFLAKGNPQFKSPVSIIILISGLFAAIYLAYIIFQIQGLLN